MFWMLQTVIVSVKLAQHAAGERGCHEDALTLKQSGFGLG